MKQYPLFFSQGRKLLATLSNTARDVHLLMDRSYEGDATRELAFFLSSNTFLTLYF